MKKLLAVLLAAIMVLSLVACGAKEEAKTEAPAEAKTEAKTEAPKEEKKAEEPAPAPAVSTEPQVLRVAHKGDPTSLCHLNVTFASTNGPIDNLIYDRLVDYDADNKTVVPMLATEWEAVDAQHIRFTLRDDIVAHDGSKFTASDVLYTLKAGKEGGKVSNYYGGWDIDNCVVEDDTHIVIATTTPDPFALYTLSNIPLGMLCEASVNAKGTLADQDLMPTAGTGPYKVSEWSTGTQITLVRNEQYWGEKPYFDSIEIKIITDASARAMALESGDVDIALEPAASQIAMIAAEDGFKVWDYATPQVTFLHYNCVEGPFADENLRIACSLALNYDANMAIAASNFGTLTDSFLSTASSAYSKPEASFYHFDLALAKDYMAKSAYPNGLTVKVLYAEGATFKAYAEMIQQQWAALGITVELDPMARAAHDEKIATGDFQVHIINASNPDPYIQTRYYDGRLGFAAIRGGTGWTGPEELNGLIDAAKQEIDAAKRTALYADITKIICEHCPCTPLYSPNKTCLSADKVQGIKLTEFSDINFAQSYFG